MVCSILIRIAARRAKGAAGRGGSFSIYKGEISQINWSVFRSQVFDDPLWLDSVLVVVGDMHMRKSQADQKPVVPRECMAKKGDEVAGGYSPRDRITAIRFENAKSQGKYTGDCEIFSGAEYVLFLAFN